MNRSWTAPRHLVGHALLLMTATLVSAAWGCGSGSSSGALDPPSPGVVDRAESVHLRIDEASISTRFDAQGAVVSVPVETLMAGSEATLQVSLTPLDQTTGPTGTATFALEAGTHTIEVRIDGFEPSGDQAELAAQLVRYKATVAGSDAAGARSLLQTVRPLGVRVWAPQSMDAGSTSAVRVWVRDLSSGALLEDVEVSLLGQTELTDATGQAEFDVVAPDGDQATLALDIEARFDGAVSVAARSIALVPAGAPKLFLSTDKPLYRPGQTIHIRALALAARDLGPLEDMDVTLEVLDGKQNKVFKEVTRTDAFGIASLTAPLAPQVNVGQYTIRAVTPILTQELAVEVSEEKLPKYAVDVTFDEPWFAPGEPITGVVSARYFFGKAVAGATVTIDTGAASSARPGLFTGTTDAEGLLPFELPGSTAGASALAVSVTDTAGFTVAKVAEAPIAVPQLIVQAIPESTSVPVDQPWQLYVLTRGPLGGPIAASCHLGEDEASAFDTNASGIAVVEVDAGGGDFLSVSCSDPTGLSGSVYAYPDPAWAGSIILRADRAIYAPGDPITLSLVAGGSTGDAAAQEVTSVYVDVVHRGRIVDTQVVALTEGAGSLEVQATPGLDGILSFTAYFVRDDDAVVTTERLVYVQKPCATVTVETDAPEYLPGAEATLTFQVSDPAGVGKAAAIGVTIADEAVFALAGSTNDPSAVKRYFLLDDAPADIRGYALAADPSTVQLLAQAALADEAAPSHATASGLTVSDLTNQAHQKISPFFQGWVAELQGDLQAAVDAKTLTASNAADVLASLVLYDFWGQRIRLTPEVYDDPWSSYLYLTVRSAGPDELMDTDDDLSRVQYLYFPVDREYSNDESSAGYSSADAAGGMGGAPLDDADGDGLNGPDPSEQGGGKAAAAPKKRDDFPETLYVNPSLITDGTGKAVVTLPLADVITTWRVSMTANTAGGLVGGATGGITVFQDFFVDVDLPRKLTQGDQLALPVAVFNFDDVDHDVTVTVTESAWFALGGPNSQQLTVPAGSSVAVPFAIEVLEPGHHAVEITALSDSGGDALVRTVDVTPDGQQLDDAHSGPLEGDMTVQIAWPDNAIAGGNDAVVKLMGGPSAQMVDGVDALLAAPRGCFEPMMNSTWINALVLDYLKWTGDSKPDLESRALANLDSGIQQSITFECTGGGFTWFGDPDPAHSILTAFGLLMFQDIGQHKEVDPGLVTRARALLEGRQQQDGHWSSDQGTKNQLIPWDDLRTSCIVAWGLADNGGSDSSVMAGGVSYILQEIVDAADTYTLAMCANALLTAAPEDPATDALVADLLDRASQDAQGLTYWDSDYPGVSNAGGEVAQVETTALVAQALYRLAEPPLAVESAMKFLAGKKSPDGNFRSTQGTIQSMRAFVAAARLAAGETDADVTVRVGDEVVYETHIDSSNREVVHLVSLAGWANADIPLSIEVSGEGKLYYQVSDRHFRPWDPALRRVGPSMDITVDYEPSTAAVGEAIVATIGVTNTGGASVTAGDMPMVEFMIPPGFDGDLTQLDKLVVADPNVARYELKADKVLIYLHELGTEPGDAFSVAIPLSARFPMEITTRPGRVWEFFKPDSVSESLPVVLTVTGS